MPGLRSKSLVNRPSLFSYLLPVIAILLRSPNGRRGGDSFDRPKPAFRRSGGLVLSQRPTRRIARGEGLQVRLIHTAIGNRGWVGRSGTFTFGPAPTQQC